MSIRNNTEFDDSIFTILICYILNECTASACNAAVLLRKHLVAYLRSFTIVNEAVFISNIPVIDPVVLCNVSIFHLKSNRTIYFVHLQKQGYEVVKVQSVENRSCP